MINFDEELKKYKPSLEVNQAEEAIQRNDLRDVIDIVEEMMKEFHNDSNRFKQF
ncbi:hypothetical protein [Frisingicoccus sp.]|uniref:hypothetical protein n=1 Tax=Frisingicoccus sp. TaxID=1918627 RepID=UPI003AB8A02E